MLTPQRVESHCRVGFDTLGFRGSLINDQFPIFNVSNMLHLGIKMIAVGWTITCEVVTLAKQIRKVLPAGVVSLFLTIHWEIEDTLRGGRGERRGTVAIHDAVCLVAVHPCCIFH